MTGRETSSDLLSARVGDLMEKAQKGELSCLPFLTPRDAGRARKLLGRFGMSNAAWFWGGYPSAERVCLFLLPDYLLACLPEERVTDGDEEVLKELLREELDEAVCALRISGSRYETLTHRDYLGALLALGLERDAFGDIAVQNAHEAVVFCPKRLIPFLTESLSRVARDTVRCSVCVIDEHFTDGRKYAPIHATVASARLDCVVAALTNLSREAAQTAVRSGLVEIEFETEERTDAVLTPPVTLSVRGYGRFILRAFDGETRKGRLRLRADKLI